MRRTLFGVMLSSLTVACLAVSAPRAPASEPIRATLPTLTVNADQGIPVQSAAYGWRYRYYGGRWWYWTPQNNWAYWYGNAWVPYGGVYSYGYNPYPNRYYTGYRGVYPSYEYFGPRRYAYYGPRYGYYGRRYRW
jgi:hypothetical protein